MARLATADAAGHPHVVPVCFARVGTTLYVPIDAKPKRAHPRSLRRLRNLRERSEATLLLDHYDEDWSRLRWLMIRGRTLILEPDDSGRREALAALEQRYSQYATMRLAALNLPVISLIPTHVSRRRSLTTP